ncbi:hypothetical protein Cylst_4107 [Cylindrospermum stagnale PCC 7417]|uniref:Uncharacterized protein n=1 Tax=Cylindrospermum stagnale PCC 7417 TaxID=56107 RepID=K9X163_9NOST|nr:hypothetical protein Cylst_4107 [Cylindrospermum stagnale PCC 7417]
MPGLNRHLQEPDDLLASLNKTKKQAKKKNK